MKHTDSISSIQLAVIITGTMVGVSLLVLPRFIVEKAGTAAPLATLIGIIIPLVGLLGFALLGKRFPKHTLIGQNKLILGKYFGNTVNIVLIFTTIIFMGLETRQFAEVLKNALIPNTPISISVIMMITLCASVGFSNVSNFSYIHFFYFPFMVITVFLIIVFMYGEAQVYHLLPIIGHDISSMDFISGVSIASQAISNFIILGFLVPYLKHPEKIVKNSVAGYLFGALIIFAIVTISLAVFGEFEIQKLFWPTLVLGRMVIVPGELLARIDAILLIAWIFATFTTLLSYYFIFVRGLAEIAQTTQYRRISFLGIPIAFISAVLPSNIYELYNLLLSTSLFGLSLTILYPIVLLLLAKIRNMKGENI